MILLCNVFVQLYGVTNCKLYNSHATPFPVLFFMELRQENAEC